MSKQLIKDILKLVLVAFCLYAAAHNTQPPPKFLPDNLPAGVQPFI
jgi:hypothetical protein